MSGDGVRRTFGAPKTEEEETSRDMRRPPRGRRGAGSPSRLVASGDGHPLVSLEPEAAAGEPVRELE